MAFSIAALPFGGCAIAIGLIFAALLRAESYAPDLSATLFGRAMLGFALVESFTALILITIGAIAFY